MRHDPIAAGDLRACQALLRRGSRTFSAAARLLPRDVRDPATVLYAFCRQADDRVDDDRNASAATVDALRDRLRRAHAGRPANAAVDRALSVVIERHAIPLRLPDALLEGLAWDVQRRRYETVEELFGYAARVAGSVGAMMTLLMGVRAPVVLARACDLGVAMQLTNIARDVGEDAQRGRIYLPLAWMRDSGIDPDAWLAGASFDERLGRIVARLLEQADALYSRADAGVAGLPRRCRVAIRAARLLYSEIGRAIGRSRFDSVSRRAFVPAWRKLLLVARAVVGRRGLADGACVDHPTLVAAGFLVDACGGPHAANR
ncbi:MAG: phytoene/squalene synthase family protein [Myxococcota bacterium]|nr:phytoene/squalene synthase family protein [Myxococcota bacterium]